MYPLIFLFQKSKNSKRLKISTNDPSKMKGGNVLYSFEGREKEKEEE